VPPLFSVVIPTYNSAGKVVRAVQSVLEQTLNDYELVVVDDGSSDDTAERLQPWMDRIQYVHQANAGVAAARNHGIEMASGCYVAFLDADDWWYERKLARVAEAAAVLPEVGLFYSPVDFVTAGGERLWTYRSEDHGVHNYPALLMTDFVMTSSTVVRRDVFDQVGTFDTSLASCEDWDMWIRIARSYGIHLIREPLTAYEYLAGGSLTSRTARWIEAHNAVMEKSLQADASLSRRTRRRVRAAVAYRKAKVYLSAGDERSAALALEASLSHHWLRWEVWLYLAVLHLPMFRRLLPGRIKRALRLPESLRGQLSGGEAHG
jgi:GT2 family glycosyltransferase